MFNFSQRMNWNFSPLEQFDSVTFIGGSRFFESINLYSFYIFETEYSAVERIQNGYTSFIGLPVASSVTFYLVIFVFAALFFAKTFMKVSLDMLPVFSSEVRFSNFFFALVFSIFLPTAFDFVFLTVPFFQEGLFSANFYTTNSLDVLQNGLTQTLTQSSFKLEALPQNHFFFFFDENLISFVLAFFSFRRIWRWRRWRLFIRRGRIRFCWWCCCTTLFSKSWKRHWWKRATPY